MSDGKGCLCEAHSYAECGCPNVDWTPQQVYDLKDKCIAKDAKIKELTQVLDTAHKVFAADITGLHKIIKELEYKSQEACNGLSRATDRVVKLEKRVEELQRHKHPLENRSEAVVINQRVKIAELENEVQSAYDLAERHMNEKHTLTTTNEKFVEALDKYGDHLKCEKLVGASGCDCGFDDTLYQASKKIRKD